MISLITYGRNDNYSFNLVKRVALSFNCLAEILTEEDEILFADYNTPDHLPSLPEAIWDTLTEKALRLLKVVRIPAALHEQIKKDSPLPILENISRNAALVRSNPQNRWVLSTNPDVVLVLASQWPSLAELVGNQPESFYEMPRFDIPESVWSSLRRDHPAANMQTLRDWLVAHQAAVVETIPDHRFQPFYLFDAPGDFQLAPRRYFFRLRGFDEAMNKYFHSDSNLAKRMWLLNGRRTDHLLGHLWVAHQDHYLSGEWTRTVTTIEHNDYHKKVIQEETLEANDDAWGLQHTPLPFFSLAEKIKRQRISVPERSASCNGNLPLSREINWQTQPYYRLCHYQPELVALYLREILRVIPPDSKIVYVGENLQSFQSIQQAWLEISPSGSPLYQLSDAPLPEGYAYPDLLLVDCFYERSEYWETRIRLFEEQLRVQVAQGRLREEEANGELARFADIADSQTQEGHLLDLWNRHFPSLTLRPGAYVILLGCNVYVPAFLKFQELLSQLCGGVKASPTGLQKLHAVNQRLKYLWQKAGKSNPLLKFFGSVRLLKRRILRGLIQHESLMGWVYYRHLTRRRQHLIATMNLRTLYTHHRLVVMRVPF